MMSGLLIAVVGVSVLAAVIVGSATSWWLAHNAPEQRRLRTLSPAGGPDGTLAPAQSLTDDQLDPMLQRLSRLASKSPKEMSRLQRRLTRAGYPTRAAAIYFTVAQLLLPVVGALLVLITLGFGAWLYALLGAAAGYVLPGLWVSRKTAQRHKAVQNGLADALDLLTVCVEAGSGLDQAIAKASEELEIAHPVVASEFRAITTEVRAGKSRLEAFKNFSQRTGVDDVRSLVAMMTQTDRFGTSIGQALRAHAETIRSKRRQRAEERAAKVGVKLVFPLALCLFPALYVVCFGAVVVRIYKAFF